MELFISHFGIKINPDVEHFAKEFGLILLVYSIGLQVGPGFFSSLRKGGLSLNLMASSIVLLGCIITYIIHLITGVSLTTMVGILTGAVTNTPSLGAAQQIYFDSTNNDPSSIALGYAVAYPLGVIGIILSMVLLRGVFARRVKLNDSISNESENSKNIVSIDVKVTNPQIIGRDIKDIIKLVNRDFVVSRVLNAKQAERIATGNIKIKEGDILRIVAKPESLEAILTFIGESYNYKEEITDTNLISRRIVVTKEDINGRTLSSLNIRSQYEVNITRVNRAGIDLVASNDLILQVGDRVTVVGNEENINKVAGILGNSMKRLDHPNLFPIFFGIFLGVLLGSIPFVIPGIPQPVKLGLAGGPLIVAILVSRFGPYYKMVTFTTTSANMMLREIGISIFLATVGLGAGGEFVKTILQGGYWWVLYGFAITIIPLLIVGVFALYFKKLDGGSLMGLLAGSTTDPPALAYANGVISNDKASISYATVYPLTMFLRVLTAQILILLSLS